MKWYIYSVIVLLLIGVQLDVKAQMSEQYLLEAAANNPMLKAKYAEFEAAMQRAARSNALPDPTLSFGYFIMPVETRVGPQRARFSLSQMFPWFGTLAAKKDMMTLQAEAKYQEFLDARNEVYYEVKKAWYPLYENKQTLQLQEENIEILRTYKRLATTAFKNGKGSLSDALRTDIMIDMAATEIQLLQQEQTPLLVRFNSILNRPETAVVNILDSLPDPSIDMSYRKDSLLQRNPVLNALDLRLQSVQVEEKLAKKQGLPKFGVGLDYVIVGQRNDVTIPDNGNDVLMPMVSMSLPIFRGKYRSAVKEAQYMQDAISAKKEAFTNELNSKYATAEYQLSESYELIKLYDQQIVTTKQVTDLLLTDYSNSGKDYEEVLRMQQQLLKYKIAKVNALKDYYTVLAQLDYITSKSE
ncbi:MAG: TolC family protein [Chitinophagales bacterium]|nr:TolC family protein [Chitinophagaceae bacterium]MCB9065866.1 TolC family protein [Chitinophagales bacterium]